MPFWRKRSSDASGQRLANNKSRQTPEISIETAKNENDNRESEDRERDVREGDKNLNAAEDGGTMLMASSESAIKPTNTKPPPKRYSIKLGQTGSDIQHFQSRSLDKLANFDWYLEQNQFILRCHSTGRDLEDYEGALVSESPLEGNKYQRWRYEKKSIINVGTGKAITLTGNDETDLGVKMKKWKPGNIDQQWMIMTSGFVAKQGIPSLNLQSGIPGDDLPYHVGVSFRHASGGGAQKQIFDTVLLFPRGAEIPAGLPAGMVAVMDDEGETAALSKDGEEAPLEAEPMPRNDNEGSGGGIVAAAVPPMGDDEALAGGGGGGGAEPVPVAAAAAPPMGGEGALAGAGAGPAAGLAAGAGAGAGAAVAAAPLAGEEALAGAAGAGTGAAGAGADAAGAGAGALAGGAAAAGFAGAGAGEDEALGAEGAGAEGAGAGAEGEGAGVEGAGVGAGGVGFAGAGFGTGEEDEALAADGGAGAAAGEGAGAEGAGFGGVGVDVESLAGDDGGAGGAGGAGAMADAGEVDDAALAGERVPEEAGAANFAYKDDDEFEKSAGRAGGKPCNCEMMMGGKGKEGADGSQSAGGGGRGARRESAGYTVVAEGPLEVTAESLTSDGEGVDGEFGQAESAREAGEGGEMAEGFVVLASGPQSSLEEGEGLAGGEEDAVLEGGGVRRGRKSQFGMDEMDEGEGLSGHEADTVGAGGGSIGRGRKSMRGMDEMDKGEGLSGQEADAVGAGGVAVGRGRKSMRGMDELDQGEGLSGEQADALAAGGLAGGRGGEKSARRAGAADEGEESDRLNGTDHDALSFDSQGGQKVKMDGTDEKDIVDVENVTDSEGAATPGEEFSFAENLLSDGESLAEEDRFQMEEDALNKGDSQFDASSQETDMTYFGDIFSAKPDVPLEACGSGESGFEGYIKIGGECKCPKSYRRPIVVKPRDDEIPSKPDSQNQKNENCMLLESYSAMSLEISPSQVDLAVRQVLLRRLSSASLMDLDDFGFAFNKESWEFSKIIEKDEPNREFLEKTIHVPELQNLIPCNELRSCKANHMLKVWTCSNAGVVDYLEANCCPNTSTCLSCSELGLAKEPLSVHPMDETVPNTLQRNEQDEKQFSKGLYLQESSLLVSETKKLSNYSYPVVESETPNITLQFHATLNSPVDKKASDDDDDDDEFHSALRKDNECMGPEQETQNVSQKLTKCNVQIIDKQITPKPKSVHASFTPTNQGKTETDICDDISVAKDSEATPSLIVLENYFEEKETSGSVIENEEHATKVDAKKMINLENKEKQVEHAKEMVTYKESATSLLVDSNKLNSEYKEFILMNPIMEMNSNLYPTTTNESKIEKDTISQNEWKDFESGDDPNIICRENKDKTEDYVSHFYDPDEQFSDHQRTRRDCDCHDIHGISGIRTTYMRERNKRHFDKFITPVKDESEIPATLALSNPEFRAELTDVLNSDESKANRFERSIEDVIPERVLSNAEKLLMEQEEEANEKSSSPVPSIPSNDMSGSKIVTDEVTETDNLPQPQNVSSLEDISSTVTHIKILDGEGHQLQILSCNFESPVNEEIKDIQEASFNTDDTNAAKKILSCSNMLSDFQESCILKETSDDSLNSSLLDTSVCLFNQSDIISLTEYSFSEKQTEIIPDPSPSTFDDKSQKFLTGTTVQKAFLSDKDEFTSSMLSGVSNDSTNIFTDKMYNELSNGPEAMAQELNNEAHQIVDESETVDFTWKKSVQEAQCCAVINTQEEISRQGELYSKTNFIEKKEISKKDTLSEIKKSRVEIIENALLRHIDESEDDEEKIENLLDLSPNVEELGQLDSNRKENPMGLENCGEPDLGELDINLTSDKVVDSFGVIYEKGIKTMTKPQSLGPNLSLVSVKFETTGDANGESKDGVGPNVVFEKTVKTTKPETLSSIVGLKTIKPESIPKSLPTVRVCQAVADDEDAPPHFGFERGSRYDSHEAKRDVILVSKSGWVEKEDVKITEIPRDEDDSIRSEDSDVETSLSLARVGQMEGADTYSTHRIKGLLWSNKYRKKNAVRVKRNENWNSLQKDEEEEEQGESAPSNPFGGGGGFPDFTSLANQAKDQADQATARAKEEADKMAEKAKNQAEEAANQAQEKANQAVDQAKAKAATEMGGRIQPLGSDFDEEVNRFRRGSFLDGNWALLMAAGATLAAAVFMVAIRSGCQGAGACRSGISPRRMFVRATPGCDTCVRQRVRASSCDIDMECKEMN